MALGSKLLAFKSRSEKRGEVYIVKNYLYEASKKK
jgi:hypothetical protein